MGNSISVALQSDEERARQEKIERMFSLLDEDGSGEITAAELREWISDERFVGNEQFSAESLSEASRRVEAQLDQDKDGRVRLEDLRQYLEGVPTEAIDAMTQSLAEGDDAERDAVLERVYHALDTDGDGRVSRDEILFWLENENRWKEELGAVEGKRHEDAREMIYRMIDRDASGDVSFDELRRFFASWKVRELRRFTADQLYFHALAEVANDPENEEARERLAKIKKDRAFYRSSRRAERRRDREARRKSRKG